MLELAVKYTPRTLATALYLITMLVIAVLTLAARLLVSKKASRYMSQHARSYDSKRSLDTWFVSRKQRQQPVRWLWSVKQTTATVPVIRHEAKVWDAPAATA